ncbi:MAG: ATP-binding protein [Coriobacteriales bacterium]
MLAAVPKRLLVAALCIAVSLGMVLPLPAAAAAAGQGESPRVVRVGFFAHEGYHELSQDGTRSGYGYDFDLLLRRYSNLNFEYLGYDKTWEESLQMLREGKVDMLTTAHKTAERMAEFDFSLPIGTNSVELTVRKDDERYTAGEYAGYNGMKVGMIRKSSNNAFFAEYAASRGFTFKARYYDTAAEVAEALASGEVDAAATSTLRLTHDEKTLDEFGTQYFYAIVRKGDAELLAEINRGIERMDASEGDWRARLFSANYGVSAAFEGLEFDEEELAYIAAHSTDDNPITVGTATDWPPFSYLDNGQITGMAPSCWDAIAQMAGLCYRYGDFTANPNLLSAEQGASADDPMPDIYLCYSLDEASAERNGMVLTPPIFVAGASMLLIRGGKDIETIAVCSSTQRLNKTLQLQPGQRTAEYPSSEDAVEALKRGKVDAVYVYTYDAMRLENSDSSGLLVSSFVPGVIMDICIAAPDDGDHVLMSILSKCINQMSQEDTEAILSSYVSFQASDLTLKDMVMLHPNIALAVIVVCVLLVIGAVVVFLRQRSKRKLAEQRRQDEAVYRRHIEDALDAAEHANKAKTVFLSTMSHDIRTPMNAVMGYSELAQEHLGEPELLAGYLSKISTSGRHLLSLINDILDMSRIESGNVKLEPVPVNLPAAVADVEAIVRSTAQAKDLDFTVDVRTLRNPDALCDRLRLNQVLINLLSNAVKYTKPGGYVRFELEELACAHEGFGRYRFTVSDNGIGMSEEFQKHLFESFTREESSDVSATQGTGLGLAITKTIIEMMGGTVSVHSQQGLGSTFRVELELQLCAPQAEPQGGQPQPQPQQADFSGKRALLAEDNEMNREIACAVLEGLGLEVVAVEDGDLALQRLAAAEPGFFSIVLLDIQMPRMNGYATARAIRALDDPALSRLPIVAMTADAFEEDRQQAFEAGMDAHVAKPIEVPELVAALSELLA